MLSTFIMTMRGTPYYYFGDELGMTNAQFEKIEEFRDVQTLNEYQHAKNTGANLQKLLKRMQFSSRDNGRTPFAWNAGPNAGFTSGKPWIKLAPNHAGINRAVEEADSNSCLNYFRKLVRLRKEYPQVLVYGKYELVDKTNPNVYAYFREGGGQKMLILLNFSSSEAEVKSSHDILHATLLLSNEVIRPVIDKGRFRVTLKPYQAVIYKL